MNDMNYYTNFVNKRILVTGGCGTVGSELVRQLLECYSVAELITLDNNESELFFFEQQFSKYDHARFYLADIRDQQKLSRLMENIDTFPLLCAMSFRL